MKSKEVQKTLQDNLPYLNNKYGVLKLGVFGSFATGEEHKNSDVDVLVEFEKPIGIFKFVNLKFYLEEKLQKKVDLVTKNALKPLIKNQILQEIIYI